MNYRAQINHAKRDAITRNFTDYKQIGKGAFSRVLVHPDAPDVVIKVGTYRSRHRFVRERGLVDGFPEFARICQRSRSKFYPKIYHIEDDGETFVVVMKRYHPNRKRKLKWEISATASTLQNRRTYLARPNLSRFKRALQPLTGFILDLHGKNIMQDENGTPILTDPIVQRRTYA